MSSSAARAQQAYRRRVAGGRIVLNIEVDEVAVTELLAAAGLLAPLQDHDRDALERGLERLIETLIRYP